MKTEIDPTLLPAMADGNRPSWDVLARFLVRIAEGVSPYGPSVIPLGELPADVFPSVPPAMQLVLIINSRGTGPGGQELIDRIRQLLANRGMLELGFGTSRQAELDAPLCPSEGWALLAKCNEDRVEFGAELSRQIAAIEREIYAAKYQPVAIRGPLPMLTQVSSSMPELSIAAELSVAPQMTSVPSPAGTGQELKAERPPVVASLKLRGDELLALIAHWARRIVDIEYLWIVEGATSRQWVWDKGEACDRLERLVGLGVATADQIQKLLDEERVKAGLQPSTGGNPAPLPGTAMTPKCATQK